VVASAVMLKSTSFRSQIADSKKLTLRQRHAAFHEIFERACVGVGIMNEAVIDEHNILRATWFAMTNAVRDLVPRLPSEMKPRIRQRKSILLLVDGNLFRTDLPYAYRTIVSGDNLSLSIACASIVAKVVRDRLLESYHKVFPQYGFFRHKGYPTRQHRAAIREFGPSPIHRMTFRGVV